MVLDLPLLDKQVCYYTLPLFEQYEVLYFLNILVRGIDLLTSSF